MTMGPVMEYKPQSAHIAGVDDGTGNNPQEGYFAITKMVGPFKSKAGADEYLKKQCSGSNDNCTHQH